MVKQTLTQIEPEARKLRDMVDELRNQLADAENSLEGYVDRCPHNFNVSYDPIHHEGYTMPADGAGSDYRPSFYVSPRTEERWKRECSRCGLLEYTTQVEQEVHRKPKW
ncbi:hypothetical protein HYT23_03305 [Candidatus Pacearchaeota archaeon]|nr:hypothetical protein [Candidatus Pacearchaeota archaeon]